MEDFIIKNSVLIFFVLLFALILLYISKKIGKRTEYCNVIESSRFGSGAGENDNIKEFLNIDDLIRLKYLKGKIDLNNTMVDYDYKLKDFYIKTAYNCFCNSGFRNGYVDNCALINCASYGVRALHMQIFSLDQTPILGVNSMSTNDYKESYNEISFKDAMSTIDTVYNDETFGTKDIDDVVNSLKEDPLFLILQLHYGTNLNTSSKNDATLNHLTPTSNKKRFYNQIYNTLVSQFGMERFASTELRRIYPDFEDNRQGYISNMKMKDTKNKIFVFVIVNGTDNYNDVKDSNLNKIVSLYGDNDLNHYRFNEINKAEQSHIVQKQRNKQSLALCMPPLASSYANYDFVQIMKGGTQFIAMNFQNNDSNLNFYNNFFVEQHNMTYGGMETSPYIKKPDHMIDLPLPIRVS